MLRSRVFYRNQAISIRVIEVVTSRYQRTATHCRVAGTIEALMVIVNESGKDRAYDIQGQPVDPQLLDYFRQLPMEKSGSMH